MAVDREFAYVCLCVYSLVICCSPLNILGPHFAFLGMTLASLVGGPFRATWAPQGLSLGSYWHSFGSLGMPVRPFGTPWAPKWSLG